jgi:UDP-glucuronate decarboxylase
LFTDYHRSNHVDIRIARIFNTYGPRMAEDDGRVVSNFIVQALRGGPLTVYGDGSQSRSFCYVDDLVDGLMRLIEYEGPECHEPHNLGNPREFTMLELAEQVRKLINPNLEIRFEPLPADDPRQRRPDITRAASHLSWQPRVELAEGLARTIDYFRGRVES